MEIPQKFLIPFVFLLLIVTAANADSSDTRIKYVDPSNNENYIIFYQDLQKFEIHQECGADRAGEFWETENGYHLTGNAFFAGELKKANGGIVTPDKEVWIRDYSL